MNSHAPVTALVLTYNEEENIARTLDSISWVEKILIIDSGSTDRTLEIVKQYPQAEVLHRKFTTFAAQCNFGLTYIRTPWVLSIDADYVFPVDAENAIRKAVETAGTAGFAAKFDYAIYGKTVKGSLLPPRTVLYRRDCAEYQDDGHGHRVRTSGEVGELPFNIIHDDRKPLSRWASSQIGYAAIEADKLTYSTMGELPVQDKIRKMIVVAPLLVFLLVYVFRGGFLSGWHGLYYALQRFFAELLCSIFLLDNKIRGLFGQDGPT